MMEEPDSTPKCSTSERLLAGAALVGLAGVAALVRLFNPSVYGFFPTCPFHSLTGLSCPGCGLTRGFHALFHGDLAQALQFNLLLPVYLIFFAFVAMSLALVVFRGRGLSFEVLTTKTVYGYVAVSLSFAVLRNLPYYPFELFAV